MAAPTGATAVAAVLGSPIAHSRSPAMLNAAFAATGLDWVFVACDVTEASAADAVRGLRALGVRGASVTMPLKAAMVDLVDEVDPEAAALQSVNCLWWRGESLVGSSTDGAGFVRSLDAEGVAPAGLRVVVVGAGAAARAVVHSLAAAGASEVVVVNRTPAKAEAAAALAGTVGRVGVEDDLRVADLVVNATSVGMADTPGAGALPFDAVLLRAGQVVADLVYHPLRTPLLDAAAAAGARPIGGIGMLVQQAALAFERWTGVPAPVDVLTAAALDPPG
jgi:shikimate dehydrogenase